jgi:uncharacterized lipoprotein YajG
MNMVTGRSLVLIGISALALAGCSAPEPKLASADGAPKPAAAKCNRVADAPVGALLRKDCSSTSNSRQVDPKEFLESAQIPGAVPQK